MGVTRLRPEASGGRYPEGQAGRLISSQLERSGLSLTPVCLFPAGSVQDRYDPAAVSEVTLWMADHWPYQQREGTFT